MPARKSEAVKNARGTLRESRRKVVPAGERLLDPPPPPAGLDPAARHEWVALAETLVGVGTLTAADLRALQLLAETLQTVRDLAATIALEGVTIPGASGNLKAHPALATLATSRAQAARLLDSFGLTPRARGAVDAAPGRQDDTDPAAEFFN